MTVSMVEVKFKRTLAVTLLAMATAEYLPMALGTISPVAPSTVVQNLVIDNGTRDG